MVDVKTNYLKIHFNHELQIGIGMHTGNVITG